MPHKFPYRAKALFAFEEIDGNDVCFFGMHVQEYGSDSPQPNRRRVYVAYLDSVHFFRPRQFRTAVYHEILLAYLDYVKQLGYVDVFWSDGADIYSTGYSGVWTLVGICVSCRLLRRVTC